MNFSLRLLLEYGDEQGLEKNLASCEGVTSLVALLSTTTDDWDHPFPSARLSLGVPQRLVASERSANPGSEYFEFPVVLVNDGPISVWTEGYRQVLPFYEIATRKAGAAEWHKRSGGFCGTGAEIYPVSPGQQLAFKITVPIEYAGREIKVTTVVATKADCRHRLEIASEPAEIPH